MRTYHVIILPLAVALLSTGCEERSTSSSDAQRPRNVQPSVSASPATSTQIATSSTATATAHPVESIAKPEFTFSTDQFADAYGPNKPAFMRKYGNKVIQLTATVEYIYADWIQVSAGNGGGGGRPQLTCYFAPSEVKTLDRLRQKGEATIVGRVTPQGSWVDLRSCRLVTSE